MSVGKFSHHTCTQSYLDSIPFHIIEKCYIYSRHYMIKTVVYT